MLAFPSALIPLVGRVMNLGIVTAISHFASPETGLVVGLVILLYVQLEAYPLTPRIVGRVTGVPASIVLMGAPVGGTLRGLLGALIACPTTASTLLLTKKIAVPAQEAR